MEETRTSLLDNARALHNQDAWHELVRVYRPVLKAFVLSRGMTESDAEDVVQEILVKLVQALPEFTLDHSKGRFRTWLFRLSSTTAIDWIRRKRTFEPLDSQRLVSNLTPSEHLEAKWNKEARDHVLSEAIASVRSVSEPKSWQCFEQHILQRRPAAEVATNLGLNVGAVYTNASRIVGRLREKCLEYREVLDEELP